MNQQASNSNSVSHSADSATLSTPGPHQDSQPASSSRTHCRHRIRNGRYCQLPVLDLHSRLCFRHFALHNHEAEAANLSSDLATEPGDFKSAAEIQAFLAKLLRLLAQDRIPARRAAVMAYITNQLLRALTAIQQDAKTEPTTIVIDIDIDSAAARRALEAQRAEPEQSKQNPS